MLNKIRIIVIIAAVTLLVISQEVYIISDKTADDKTVEAYVNVIGDLESKSNSTKARDINFYLKTKDNKVYLNTTDMAILYRVASAEAGTKYDISIKHVVTVILNRICNPAFRYDKDVESTVFRYRQFSCVQDGNYSRAVITKNVINAVNEAVINYEYKNDITEGATHYANLSICDPDWQYTMKKLDNVKDPAGHTFFK